MAQYMFGTGRLTQMPVGGGTAATFGALQNVSVDFSGDLKELWGRNQFPLDVARGKAKIIGKAAFANIDSVIYNSTFFGQTLTPGMTNIAESEAATVPAAPGPYTCTIAHPASWLYSVDVRYANNPAKFILTAGPPTGARQYNCAAGIYTFSAADAGANLVITYAFSQTAVGQTLTINNTLMGAVPTFQLVANGSYKTKQITLTLYACVSGKLTFPFKLDDFMINEFDFSAYDNGAGQIGVLTAQNS